MNANSLSDRPQVETGVMPTVPDSETFDRLAKLPPAEYDRCRRCEAKQLKIRIGTLDLEVNARRAKKADNTPQSGRADVAAVEVWPEPVNGAELLDEIRATYQRFMVLPPQADVLLAVWSLHTYVFDQFSFTPYLHVTSPEKECGKSTLGELMQHLCASATTPGGMSAAAMFRRIDARRPTLLLDEWDTLSIETRLAALNVFNTGFKWNGVYTVCVGDEHEDRDFHTFCPKAIIGLSAAKLPDTTRSRCFSLTLQKKLSHETVEKLTRKFDGLTFRRKCLRWANDNRDKLKDAEPAMPPGLSARQEDIAEPLLTIADACGDHWPDTARQCVLYLFDTTKTDEDSSNVELLKDIRAWFAESDEQDRISSGALRGYLCSLELNQWRDWNDGKGISPRQIANRLRPYGIQPRNIKLPAGKVVKGYYREDFDDAFSRYLSANPDAVGYPATKPETIGDSALSQSATKVAGSGWGNAENDSKIGSGSGVAVGAPVEEEV